MNLIKPSVQFMEQEFPVKKLDMSTEQHHLALVDAMHKHIELCGRTCYKSTDKITENSSTPFVQRMIDSQHYAMLEHGTIYLTVPDLDMFRDMAFTSVTTYKRNPTTACIRYYRRNNVDGVNYITTNLRYIIEHGLEHWLQYMTEPTEFHEKRVTVKYVASIHFYKDCTRHRVFSWAIESTRYCNYFKEKFGQSVSFIYPCWLKEDEIEEFEKDLRIIENIYFKWIKKGWQAQQAATFLPQATKAEVIMTGFVDDYQHFFDLRALGTTGAPHPSVKELALPLLNMFKEHGYISQNYGIQE